VFEWGSRVITIKTKKAIEPGERLIKNIGNLLFLYGIYLSSPDLQ
jgi:hypothetical protein